MAKQLFNSSEKSNFILNLTEEKYAKMASFGMLSALFATSAATAIPVIAHDSGLYVLSAAGLAVSGVICMIIAIIAAAVAAMLIGFLVIAPLIEKIIDGGDSPAPTPTIVESRNTNSSDDNGDDDDAVTSTPTPTPTPTATPIPTATPTPVPTATPTPTEVPPQPISQVNIVDASTGQLISIPNDTATSYAYPDSGTRAWSYADVNGMTAGQVRYCINEIYARHGYIFANENWLNYFKQKTWYTPSIPKAQFTDAYLNSTEVANVKLLNKYYSDRHYPEY